MSNPFAESDEGQDILALSMAGYPLAQTQGDLTYKQRLFLSYASNYYAQKKKEGKEETGEGNLKAMIDSRKGR